MSLDLPRTVLMYLGRITGPQVPHGEQVGYVELWGAERSHISCSGVEPELVVEAGAREVKVRVGDEMKKKLICLSAEDQVERSDKFHKASM